MMNEVERIANGLRASLAVNPIAAKRITALIAAVEERQDRRWLDAGPDYLQSAWRNAAYWRVELFRRMGYEPDGAGGWRRREG